MAIDPEKKKKRIKVKVKAGQASPSIPEGFEKKKGLFIVLMRLNIVMENLLKQIKANLLLKRKSLNLKKKVHLLQVKKKEKVVELKGKRDVRVKSLVLAVKLVPVELVEHVIDK